LSLNLRKEKEIREEKKNNEIYREKIRD